MVNKWGLKIVKGWAPDVVFQFVLTVFRDAAEFAFADLGLGSSRGYPRVAPGSENTGSDGWDRGFG